MVPASPIPLTSLTLARGDSQPSDEPLNGDLGAFGPPGDAATGPATPLATFDVNGTAVAAREFGAGRAVFLGDYDLVSRDERDNVPLRRNTLSDLLTPGAVPEPGSLVPGATSERKSERFNSDIQMGNNPKLNRHHLNSILLSLKRSRDIN